MYHLFEVHQELAPLPPVSVPSVRRRGGDRPRDVVTSEPPVLVAATLSSGAKRAALRKWSAFIGRSTSRHPATRPSTKELNPAGVVQEAPDAAVARDVLLRHPPRVHDAPPSHPLLEPRQDTRLKLGLGVHTLGEVEHGQERAARGLQAQEELRRRGDWEERLAAERGERDGVVGERGQPRGPPLLEDALRRLRHDGSGHKHGLAELLGQVVDVVALHLRARLDDDAVAHLDAGDQAVVDRRISVEAGVHVGEVGGQAYGTAAASADSDGKPEGAYARSLLEDPWAWRRRAVTTRNASETAEKTLKRSVLMPRGAARPQTHGTAKSNITASGRSWESSAATCGRVPSTAALSSSAPTAESSAVLAASAGNPGTCGSFKGTISTVSAADASMPLTRGMFPAAVRKVTRTPRLPETSVRAS
jgi:hypothetical protein